MHLTFIITYLLFMLIIGFRSMYKIRKPDDFFVASRSGGQLSVTGSLLATILGSSAILGTMNLTYTQGWASSWLLLSASIGLFALLPLSKFVRRFGKYTLPQMLKDFYGREAEIIASIIIPIAWLGIVAAQIIGAAKIINSFSGLEYSSAVILTGSVFTIYTIVGGQFSILKTDFIQSILIIGGLLVLATFISSSSTTSVITMQAESFPFNENFSFWDLLVLLLTFSATFVVGPDIYSRLFCAKDEKTAFRSVLWSAIIILFVAFLLAYIGIYTINQYPDIDFNTSASLIDLITNEFPDWLSGLVVAALLSAVMSSADTTLLTASIILSEPHSIQKQFSMKKTRINILILGILSIFLALHITSIINSLLLSLSFFSGAFIIPIIAGLLGYRTNKKNAIFAMIIGGLFALSGKLILIYSIEPTYGYLLIFSSYIINATILFLSIIRKKLKI